MQIFALEIAVIYSRSSYVTAHSALDDRPYFNGRANKN